MKIKMTKDEFIERYGEERYRQHIKNVRANYRLTHPKKESTRKMRKKLWNDTSTSVFAPCPKGLSFEEADKYKRGVATVFQRDARREWNKVTDRDFILIVEDGSRKGDFFKMHVTLNQLGITIDVKKKFKEVIDKMVMEREW